MKTINNELIRTFSPCYDPAEKGIPDGETLPVREWVEKYRAKVPTKDIIWLLCHEQLLGKRDLRLFAVLCAREALKLVDTPDPRNVTCRDVAEQYANGDATEEELRSAAAAADAATAYAAAARAADDAAYAAAYARAAAVAYDVAYAAAARAARAAAAAYDVRAAQLEQLMMLLL